MVLTCRALTLACLLGLALAGRYGRTALARAQVRAAALVVALAARSRACAWKTLAHSLMRVPHRPPQEEHDAVLVLAGGVGTDGRPHEAVLRRLRRAARLHSAAKQRGHRLAIVTNGGGTTHKPKWVSPAGYAVPEAALMGRELHRLGVDPSDVYLEALSDDTIGNAYYARTIHADPARWRRRHTCA